MNILKVHRDPKNWGNDSEQFIPERFDHERIQKVAANAYLPFTSKNELFLIVVKSLMSFF